MSLLNRAPQQAAQPNTFSGKWYPGMPDFDQPDDEFEWLEAYEAEHGFGQPQLDINGAIGDIAKYLPMGANPTEAHLMQYAYQVAEGSMSAQEAANRLSNKKIIIKKQK